MNQEQINYFRNVNQLTPRFYSSALALRSFDINNNFTMADIVDKAVDELQTANITSRRRAISIREDAITFLNINAQLMVFGPLTPTRPNIQLRLNIFQDIKDILSEAAASVSDQPRSEITSHQVLSAVNKLWNQLRTLKADSW